MKTLYLKAFGRILAILFFGVFIQNATAAGRAVLLKKLLLNNSYVGLADTPRQVSEAKKVIVNVDRDRDKDRDNDKDKDKKHPEDGTDDDISGRQDQETARTRDLAINAVPTERLIQARRIKDRLVAQRANLVKSANAPGVVPPTASVSDITWTERGPNNVGGRTRALMFDIGDVANGYKRVFAGGVGGGLWVTNDITATPVVWNKINDFFENIAISCIAQNPVNPKIIYAGTGEGYYNGDAIQGLGVWKSTDGGATWARLISTSFYTNINAITVDKNGSVYLAARDFGIMKSADGGSTWSTAISTTGAADVQLAANGDVYASDGVFSAGHIYVSDFAVNGANTGNSGTWTNITPGTSGVITPGTTSWWRIKLACAPGDANTVYALFEGTNTYSLTSFQRYNKATNTWTVKTTPTGSTFNNGQAWYSIAAAVDPTNANVIYAGSLDGGRSTDGGTTWTVVTQWYVGEVGGLNADQYVHADHHAYTYAPGSATRFLMGTDGGIFYTSTATAAHPSFADRNNGYNVTQFYSVALHPTNLNYALAGAQDNGTQQFTSAGINATNEATGGDGGNAFIDQANGNIQLTSYVNNNFWVSTDNGVTFVQHFLSNTGSFINPSDYDSNTKNLYAGNSGGSYFRWNNITTGTSTSVVTVTAFNAANITAVTVAPITANRVYFGLDNGTVAVVDNANTGTSIAGSVLSPNTSGYGSVSCIAVDPASEDHIMVTYFNYGFPSIYETKNAKAASPVWTLVEGNLPDMPVRWAMFYPGASSKAIIATELGVWSTDLLNGTSTNWSPTNSGLANVEVDMLKFRASDRTLAAATHGRGLFTTTLPVITPIATLSNLVLSAGALNPSFTSSTISYTATVPNATSSVKITPTVTDASATVKVNGVAVTSGTASASIALSVGSNTITTVVTAGDGTTTKTYTVTVVRASPGVPLPVITYPSPQAYTAGTAIPALNPTNTGGAVPATTYSAVSIFAGSGVAGNTNGTGAAATFMGPRDMATDAAGNIYLVDYTANLIRKMTPAGVVTTFAGSGAIGNTNGTGTAASFNRPAGIAIDAAGNVYIADSGNNLIRKITPAGVVTTFAGSGAVGTVNGAGTVARFNNPHAMTIDAAGNLYVSDFAGNTVRKITPAAVVSTFAGSGTAGNANGTGGAASFNGPSGLGADASGNIYVADYTNNLIRKITPSQIVTTFAGSGTAGSTDGTGTAASFKSPYAVTTDVAGNIYVADASNKIRKLTPGQVVTTLAGSGTAGHTNGTGTAATFNDPRGVTVSSGNMYVSDYAGHQIRKVILTGYTISPALPAALTMNVTTGTITGTPSTPMTAASYTVTAYNAGGSGSFTIRIQVKPSLAAPNIGYTTPQNYVVGTPIPTLNPSNTGGAVPATVYRAVSTLAGSGAAGSTNGTGVAATFNGLRDMATDAAGNVYAVDYTANTIRKITAAGVATTFAGSGTAGSTNGTGTAASFNHPTGVVVDAAGNVYISDSGNNLIRKITPAGVVTTFAGSGAAGISNGTGTVARFNNPHGLTIDGDGNLYVADFAGNDIRKISPAAVVTTLAGSGTAGNANGTGTAATFSGPSGLAADPSGNIYVADYTNNLIRKITPAGVTTTLAGSGTAGSTDGTGTGASFKSPYSITADLQGNVYVAEASNKIRIVTPAGAATTLAGSGTAGSTNGTGTAATFNDPRGVAIGGGNLYVADYAGHLVRKVIITGYAISPALPAGLSFNATTGAITGTPTTATAAANYTVMAWNTSGGDAAVINITVKPVGGMASASIDDPIAGVPAVKQDVSPNGDGLNDVLVIDNIEKYPDNTLQIMNRSGQLVYQAKGYDNRNKPFNGTSNITGKLQSAGTYFYSLDYKDGDEIKHKTGFIVLRY